MKTLTKAHLAARDALCTRLIHKHGALEDALQRATDALATAWEHVETALAAYNIVVDEAMTWREEIISAILSVIESHGGTWQASETGQAYQRWLSAWETGALEMIDLEPPEMPELDIDDQSDVLAELPEGPQ